MTRQDVLTSETESFTYDFLDRLTTVSGAYNNSFTYDEIGNILSKNGVSYSYDSTQPHAVDSVGGLSYSYDSNGNMTYRGSDNQTIIWDVENRPITVSENVLVIAEFIYDGDGNRIKKTEAGETVLFINRFYEKNLTTGNVTTSYYLGSRLVAQREGTELKYVHQDHLSGTSLTTSDNGTVISSIKYFPFGETKSGDASTDIKFTGQRLDGTGLYYYGARYYDPLIGRFVSPDTIIPNPADPQCFNRYTYCLNNPLKYVDPSGHEVLFNDSGIDNIEYYITNGQYWEIAEVASRIERLQEEWDTLKENEPEYTKHMEDSEIVFNVIDVDSQSQTITYNVDMKGEVEFTEPVQLKLVDKGLLSFDHYVMEKINAVGISAYPVPIMIRTDIPRSTESFTWLVSHETFHRWEQISGPRRWLFWYLCVEYVFVGSHDEMPSEKRANNYADTYYPR